MKKITIIASLLIVFTACEKADIRPRTQCGTQTPEMKSISEDGSSGTTVGNPNSLGGNGSETNPTIDPTNPNDPNNPNGGEITDPLRKKDQKDNK